ncbi:MAG: NmrA family NAD(P)-binding protein [Flavitalea sp.]
MKNITITGSLGNVGRNLATILTQNGHNVTVVTSSQDRIAEIQGLGAKAAVALINDTAALTRAFDGADAVFAMTPPARGGSNDISNTVRAGQALADAFVNAGIKRVVMLSSLGADQPSGTGPIVGVHGVEEIYRKLNGISITFLRAGLFYYNLFGNLAMIQNAHMLGANYPGDVAVPFAHPKDIAAAAAEELTLAKDGHDTRFIVSDLRKPREYAKILGAALGQPELPWIEFTDEQALEGMTNAGVPGELAKLFTEMGNGIRTGKFSSAWLAAGAQVDGKIKFEAFAEELSRSAS